MGEGHLSLGTMIVTVEPRRAGRGHLISRTIILWGGGGHLSLGTIILFQVHRERGRGGVMGVICLIFKCRTRKMEGHLSLGTIVLIVDLRGGGGGGGGGGHLCLFKCRTRETGSFVSRNNDSTCRTSHLSLGITILSVESER